MRRALALTFVLAACGGEPAPQSEEGLARAVFAILQTDDREALRNLLINEDEMEEISEAMIEQVQDKEGARRRLEERGGVEGLVEKSEKEVVAAFIVARSDAQSEIDLAAARFARMDEALAKERWGLTRADIVFMAEAGGTTHVFVIRNALKTDRGWVLTDEIRYKGKAR